MGLLSFKCALFALCFGLQFFGLLSALIKAWFSLANQLCCVDCRVCSDAAAADKHHVYGAVAPHVVLPFVVEHAGALGREADKFFHACMKKARNDLSPFEEAASSWSCRGLSNFYYQIFHNFNSTNSKFF